jgi:hypothetical protein
VAAAADYLVQHGQKKRKKKQASNFRMINQGSWGANYA